MGFASFQGTRFDRHGHEQFLVQDEASQLVPLAVDAQPGERVLDLCAAPGGKTVMMSGDMRDSGVLVACDVRARRVALLRDTVRQAGVHHAYPMHVPTEGALPFSADFDRILVDAPCSGLGTVRRDPDIKWRRHEDELAGLAERQLTLLRRAAIVLKPGGRLVYATCSSEPDENEMVVDRFLATEPGFRLLDLRRDGSAGPCPGSRHARDAPHASVRSSSRGLLRRSTPAHGLTRSVRYNIDVDPSPFPRLEPRQVLRPDGRPWPHFPGVFRRINASGAVGQRRAGAVARRPHGERGDGRARRPRPRTACRGESASRRQDRGREGDAAGTGRRRHEPASTSPCASGSVRDPSARSCRHSSVRTNAPHKAACSSREWWCRPCPSSDPATILPTSSWLRIPRPHPARLRFRSCSIAVNCRQRT